MALAGWDNEATVQLWKCERQVWAYSALRGACLLTQHANWLEHRTYRDNSSPGGADPERNPRRVEAHHDGGGGGGNLHVDPFTTKDENGCWQAVLHLQINAAWDFIFSYHLRHFAAPVRFPPSRPSSPPPPPRFYDSFRWPTKGETSAPEWIHELIWLNTDASWSVRQRGARAVLPPLHHIVPHVGLKESIVESNKRFLSSHWVRFKKTSVNFTWSEMIINWIFGADGSLSCRRET